VPTLDALLASHQVVTVITQPDRPAGRGQRVTASPVKRRAEAGGIPVLQPARLRDPEWPARLREEPVTWVPIFFIRAPERVRAEVVAA